MKERVKRGKEAYLALFMQSKGLTHVIPLVSLPPGFGPAYMVVSSVLCVDNAKLGCLCSSSSLDWYVLLSTYGLGEMLNLAFKNLNIHLMAHMVSTLITFIVTAAYCWFQWPNK